MGSTPADLKRDSEYDPDRDELAELRALLLGQQIVELQALQQRLDDPNVRAEEISQILGKAVALSIKRDGGLQRSFYPIVEQALKISIAKNPGILATSLAPIIGEAVRKAVANAFRDMAESINFTLERSLSWESMKWRFEACAPASRSAISRCCAACATRCSRFSSSSAKPGSCCSTSQRRAKASAKPNWFPAC